MFSMEDILGEFEDAARWQVLDPDIELFQRVMVRAERNRAFMREYHRRPEVKRARRAKRVPRVRYARPLPTFGGTCARCGKHTEHRPGLARPIHFGTCERNSQ